MHSKNMVQYPLNRSPLYQRYCMNQHMNYTIIVDLRSLKAPWMEAKKMNIIQI